MGNPMREKKRNLEFANEEGSALVIALLCLLVLGVTSSAIVFTTQGEMKSSAAYKYSQQAFYVANGGVQRAVSWFNSSYTPHLPSSDYDATYFPVKYSSSSVLLAGQSGGSAVYPESAIASSFYGTFANKTLEADTNNSGVYDLNASLIKHEPRTFLNPATFLTYPSALERWRVNSTGYWRTIANPIGEAQITATIENDGDTLFDRALWGIDSVSLGGTLLIDSYDPRLGPYGGLNVGNMGAVGSNGNVVGNGTITVDGSLAYGPSGSWTLKGGSSEITGPIIQLPTPHYFPPLPDISSYVGSTNVTVGAKKTATISPGSYGAISTKSDGVLILNPGVYYIDSMDMGAQSAIHIAVTNPQIPTTIFVKSGLSLDGQSIINDSGIPANLTINYSGTSAAKVSGGAGFYGEIYAPNADVTLVGTSDFYGAFIGKTVSDSGNPRIHFDEGSLNRNLIPQPFRVITWSQNVY
jgi:choice-of-anchor A domain-containing protein